MSKSRSGYISIILFLKGFLMFGNAKDSTRVAIDSTRVPEKRFAQNFSDNYTGDEFDYDILEGEAENLLVRFLKWLFELLSKVFGFDPHLSPETLQILEIIIYGFLIIGVIYFLVRVLAGKNATSFFSNKSKLVSPLNIQEEHIENIDLDRFIKDALAQNNYRLAIRYMYLRSLKQLSLHNIINWHFDKTNTDYYNEIENESIKSSFKKVSYLYDYVWYGEFDLDESSFNNAEKDFERLTKGLNYAG